MQLQSLGWSVQLSLFSQPSLEGLKTPWESLWDMGYVSAYSKARLWELPAGSAVTRQMGTKSSGPACPGSCSLVLAPSWTRETARA